MNMIVRPKLSLGMSLTIILFIPFFLWSFLGGHKQLVFGVSSDHVINFFSFLVAFLFLFLLGLSMR